MNKNDFSKIKNYLLKNGCEILGGEDEYDSGKDQLIIKLKCGHVEKKSGNNILRNKTLMCMKCKNIKQESIDDIRKIFYEKGCELISSNYISSESHLEILFSCGHIGKRSFYEFKNSSTSLCKKCAGAERYTLDDVILKLNDSDYKYFGGDYFSNESKLILLDSFGYKYSASLSSVLVISKKREKGTQAQLEKFSSSNPFTLENIKNWININQKSYNLIDGFYKNAHSKTIVLKCSYCEKEWKSNWNNLNSGKSCPFCQVTEGEGVIMRVLNNLSIKYVYQAKFKELRHKNILSIDFYLPDYNICIEYNGKQHYEPVEFFGGKKNFNEQRKRDKIKEKYCKENNIPLLVIPYWEFDNIEKILEENLLP